MPISDKKIENEIFSNLVDTAKNSSDESTTSSPLASDASEKIQDVLRESLGKAANAAEVLAQKVKINFRAVMNKDHKVYDNPTVASAVNWLADAFRDVIDKINDQGEILSFVLMIAENNFSKDNIFINFQLIKRRGEICKEVRRAKKENLIKSYEIRPNTALYSRSWLKLFLTKKPNNHKVYLNVTLACDDRRVQAHKVRNILMH